jgi:hypothetical protein
LQHEAALLEVDDRGLVAGRDLARRSALSGDARAPEAGRRVPTSTVFSLARQQSRSVGWIDAWYEPGRMFSKRNVPGTRAAPPEEKGTREGGTEAGCRRCVPLAGAAGAGAPSAFTGAVCLNERAKLASVTTGAGLHGVTRQRTVPAATALDWPNATSTAGAFLTSTT